MKKYLDAGGKDNYVFNIFVMMVERRLLQRRPISAIMFAELAPYLSNPRQTLAQILNFALVLSTAFMGWKALSVYTNSPSPIVVVLSGSMEPAFQRGDLLFLWNNSPRAEVGEIVVYNVQGKDIPIVHRVIKAFGAGDGGSKSQRRLEREADKPSG